MNKPVTALACILEKFNDCVKQNGSYNEQFAIDLVTVTTNAVEMLLNKNRQYGDSALNPVDVFSRNSAIELIKVRLDDKIARLKSNQLDDTEDAELDMLGYLLLLRIARKREHDFQSLLDVSKLEE